MTPVRQAPPARKQLNLITLVIAALVLFFVIVGQIMERQASPGDGAPADPTPLSIPLRKIDFGDLYLMRTIEVSAISDEESKSLWRAFPATELGSAEAQKIGESWERLLALEVAMSQADSNRGQTVLLYLAGQSAPIITKVSQSVDAQSVVFSKSQRQLNVTLAEGLQLLPVARR